MSTPAIVLEVPTGRPVRTGRLGRSASAMFARELERAWFLVPISLGSRFDERPPSVLPSGFLERAGTPRWAGGMGSNGLPNADAASSWSRERRTCERRVWSRQPPWACKPFARESSSGLR